MLFVLQEGRVVASKTHLFNILLLLFCGMLLSVAQVTASELMLPQVYTQQVDVSGWLMSEKLDGVRGYWDGKRMLSKNGNLFYPPAAFIKNLPPFPAKGNSGVGAELLNRRCQSLTSSIPMMAGCNSSLPSSMCRKLLVASLHALPKPKLGLLQTLPHMHSSSRNARFSIMPICSKN